ncbi:hypothetical protein CARUB_v10018309mg [Capsella rubella]|uniref:Uncharacterized protein n=1 Tax=Capsella rubella TaxID=81985 RepID=R0FRX3_9BRAS|nr:hypothetical protein CARUB_v10018309mg [Capsella rubella]
MCRYLMEEKRNEKNNLPSSFASLLCVSLSLSLSQTRLCKKKKQKAKLRGIQIDFYVTPTSSVSAASHRFLLQQRSFHESIRAEPENTLLIWFSSCHL